MCVIALTVHNTHRTADFIVHSMTASTNIYIGHEILNCEYHFLFTKSCQHSIFISPMKRPSFQFCVGPPSKPLGSNNPPSPLCPSAVPALCSPPFLPLLLCQRSGSLFSPVNSCSLTGLRQKQQQRMNLGHHLNPSETISETYQKPYIRYTYLKL